MLIFIKICNSSQQVKKVYFIRMAFYKKLKCMKVYLWIFTMEVKL